MFDRLTNMIGFGRVSLTDDSREIQELQITEGAVGQGFADRVIDRMRRVSEFGFASVPPIGSEALMLRRGGDRSQGIVVGTNHRTSRPRGLKPGDTGIYDIRGAKVMLTADGLVIDCAGLPAVIQNATTVTVKASDKVRIEAPSMECTGDIVSRADGTKVSLNGLRDAYAAHKHAGVRTGTDISAITDKPA